MTPQHVCLTYSMQLKHARIMSFSPKIFIKSVERKKKNQS